MSYTRYNLLAQGICSYYRTLYILSYKTLASYDATHSTHANNLF